MKQYKDLVSIGEALDSVLQHYNLQIKMKERLLFAEWERIVGKSIANHVLPSSFEKGVLRLRVADAIWRQELSMKSRELIGVINKNLDFELVDEIEFR